LKIQYKDTQIIGQYDLFNSFIEVVELNEYINENNGVLYYQFIQKMIILIMLIKANLGNIKKKKIIVKKDHLAKMN
jgi:hypothetical protein